VKRYFKLGWLLIIGGLFVVPIIITFVFSLSFEGTFPTLGQYWELLVTNNTFLRYFWNSLGYATATTLICITLSFPLGFVFAKVSFPGRNLIFFVFIVVMMLPFQATLLPNYIQLRDFNLLNTPFALVLPLAFAPFAVFLFRQFMKVISQELIEYASLETSSAFLIFRYVVFPQVKTAVIALSVIIFSESWNMVEPVFIFTAGSTDIHPLSVRLAALPEDVYFSAAVVYMYPLLLVFLLFKESVSGALEKYRWD